MQRFSIIKGKWAVVKLAANQEVPSWALADSDFLSITRTRDELSIVCLEALLPSVCPRESDWSLLQLHGPLALDQIDVLASMIAPLAGACVSIFTISTFDTDYILVKATQLPIACEALRASGHVLTS